ncbi:hypothetical protein OIY81_3190 [Cryptosporidium canis]|uniref:Uncharacterized protein n=1 Tax=Cryptosporidium canis TaxID=195482 RepID=A0ABQ8P532_9CRYT|nr:hypothetical protein OIY81_3190 [Cryptosporidium canis]KAJ1608020.1 hypothetical protein OJ252_2664 [Cryptosporidium canis]
MEMNTDFDIVNETESMSILRPKYPTHVVTKQGVELRSSSYGVEDREGNVGELLAVTQITGGVSGGAPRRENELGIIGERNSDRSSHPIEGSLAPLGVESQRGENYSKKGRNHGGSLDYPHPRDSTRVDTLNSNSKASTWPASGASS